MLTHDKHSSKSETAHIFLRFSSFSLHFNKAHATLPGEQNVYAERHRTTTDDGLEPMTQDEQALHTGQQKEAAAGIAGIDKAFLALTNEAARARADAMNAETDVHFDNLINAAAQKDPGSEGALLDANYKPNRAFLQQTFNEYMQARMAHGTHLVGMDARRAYASESGKAIVHIRDAFERAARMAGINRARQAVKNRVNQALDYGDWDAARLQTQRGHLNGVYTTEEADAQNILINRAQREAEDRAAAAQQRQQAQNTIDEALLLSETDPETFVDAVQSGTWEDLDAGDKRKIVRAFNKICNGKSGGDRVILDANGKSRLLTDCPGGIGSQLETLWPEREDTTSDPALRRDAVLGIDAWMTDNFQTPEDFQDPEKNQLLLDLVKGFKLDPSPFNKKLKALQESAKPLAFDWKAPIRRLKADPTSIYSSAFHSDYTARKEQYKAALKDADLPELEFINKMQDFENRYLREANKGVTDFETRYTSLWLEWAADNPKATYAEQSDATFRITRQVIEDMQQARGKQAAADKISFYQREQERTWQAKNQSSTGNQQPSPTEDTRPTPDIPASTMWNNVVICDYVSTRTAPDLFPSDEPQDSKEPTLYVPRGTHLVSDVVHFTSSRNRKGSNVRVKELDNIDAPIMNFAAYRIMRGSGDIRGHIILQGRHATLDITQTGTFHDEQNTYRERHRPATDDGLAPMPSDEQAFYEDMEEAVDVAHSDEPLPL